ASFYLFRTEDVFSEYRIEEHNWVCGAERADSAGADIISSSLGYYDFDNASLNYTYSDMDGNTTIAVKGADMAAKKGLMVFNSAGNEGNNGWHFLITPSDGDSVVAVGAVNSSGVVGSFSSYGPSADGRIKPDMASVGVSALVQSSSNNVGAASGTSFACPNMAGLATCLWQGFPEFNNMRIITALKQAGHIYTTPDDRTGYGIPDMKKAFASLLVEFATGSGSITSCIANIQWTSKDVSAMKYEIERKLPGATDYFKVGEVDPQAGDILATHSYQFDHSVSGLAPGTISYRIRQIIDTAAASFTAVYIDTVDVNLAATCTDGSAAKPAVYVQPNPTAESTVTLIVNTTDAINNMPVLIYDGNGRLLSQFSFSKGLGRFLYQVPIGKLPKGKYYIKAFNGNKAIGTAELIKP
ncbi:MAG TPA: S8 family peptidase, partial [Chitinophagaceae bacterium]|nr:S8 family peptidase [Chitinophagaceae bacterium]